MSVWLASFVIVLRKNLVPLISPITGLPDVFIFAPFEWVDGISAVVLFKRIQD